MFADEFQCYKTTQKISSHEKAHNTIIFLNQSSDKTKMKAKQNFQHLTFNDVEIIMNALKRFPLIEKMRVRCAGLARHDIVMLNHHDTFNHHDKKLRFYNARNKCFYA